MLGSELGLGLGLELGLGLDLLGDHGDDWLRQVGRLEVDVHHPPDLGGCRRARPHHHLDRLELGEGHTRRAGRPLELRLLLDRHPQQQQRLQSYRCMLAF